MGCDRKFYNYFYWTYFDLTYFHSRMTSVVQRLVCKQQQHKQNLKLETLIWDLTFPINPVQAAVEICFFRFVY